MERLFNGLAETPNRIFSRILSHRTSIVSVLAIQFGLNPVSTTEDTTLFWIVFRPGQGVSFFLTLAVSAVEPDHAYTRENAWRLQPAI